MSTVIYGEFSSYIWQNTWLKENKQKDKNPQNWRQVARLSYYEIKVKMAKSMVAPKCKSHYYCI